MRGLRGNGCKRANSRRLPRHDATPLQHLANRGDEELSLTGECGSRARRSRYVYSRGKKQGEKKNPGEAIFKRPSGSLHTGLRAESERINRRENIWYILSRAAALRRSSKVSGTQRRVLAPRVKALRAMLLFFFPKRPVSSKPQSTSAIYTNKSSPLV